MTESSLVSQRQAAMEALGVREKAHNSLDKLLDLYEAGELLWLSSHFAWETFKVNDELTLSITPYRGSL